MYDLRSDLRTPHFKNFLGVACSQTPPSAPSSVSPPPLPISSTFRRLCRCCNWYEIVGKANCLTFSEDSEEKLRIVQQHIRTWFFYLSSLRYRKLYHIDRASVSCCSNHLAELLLCLDFTSPRIYSSRINLCLCLTFVTAVGSVSASTPTSCSSPLFAIVCQLGTGRGT